MRQIHPATASVVLPLVIVVLLAACGASPTATETSVPAAASLAATIVSLPPTWTPDVRPEAALTVAAARLTPYATPSLAGFVLTVDAFPPNGNAPLTVALRARAVGPGSPGCAGHIWNFGDGMDEWLQVLCAAPNPLITPTPTAAVPVTTEFTTMHTYRQPGIYRVRFCPAQGAMCLLSAETVVQVR